MKIEIKELTPASAFTPIGDLPDAPGHICGHKCGRRCGSLCGWNCK